MTEKDMQTIFGKHLQKHPPRVSEVYELKICKGTSLAFDSVQAHQIEGLSKAQNDSLFHKIADQPWGGNDKFRFTIKKPFDCFVLVKSPAFVIIWFYKPRKPKIFIKIPILAFVKMKNEADRKSITEQMAKEIGTEILIT